MNPKRLELSLLTVQALKQQQHYLQAASLIQQTNSSLAAQSHATQLSTEADDTLTQLNQLSASIEDNVNDLLLLDVPVLKELNQLLASVEHRGTERDCVNDIILLDVPASDITSALDLPVTVIAKKREIEYDFPDDLEAAKKLFDDRIAVLDCMSEDSYKDETLKLQVLRDYITGCEEEKRQSETQLRIESYSIVSNLGSSLQEKSEDIILRASKGEENKCKEEEEEERKIIPKLKHKKKGNVFKGSSAEMDKLAFANENVSKPVTTGLIQKVDLFESEIPVEKMDENTKFSSDVSITKSILGSTQHFESFSARSNTASISPVKEEHHRRPRKSERQSYDDDDVPSGAGMSFFGGMNSKYVEPSNSAGLQTGSASLYLKPSIPQPCAHIPSQHAPMQDYSQSAHYQRFPPTLLGMQMNTGMVSFGGSRGSAPSAPPPQSAIPPPFAILTPFAPPPPQQGMLPQSGLNFLSSALSLRGAPQLQAYEDPTNLEHQMAKPTGMLYARAPEAKQPSIFCKGLGEERATGNSQSQATFGTEKSQQQQQQQQRHYSNLAFDLKQELEIEKKSGLETETTTTVVIKSMGEISAEIFSRQSPEGSWSISDLSVIREFLLLSPEEIQTEIEGSGVKSLGVSVYTQLLQFVPALLLLLFLHTAYPQSFEMSPYFISWTLIPSRWKAPGDKALSFLRTFNKQNPSLSSRLDLATSWMRYAEKRINVKPNE